MDQVSYVTLDVVLSTVSVLACHVPARRGARICLPPERVIPANASAPGNTRGTFGQSVSEIPAFVSASTISRDQCRQWNRFEVQRPLNQRCAVIWARLQGA